METKETKIFFAELAEFAEAVAIWYRAGLYLYIEQGCGGGWWVIITGCRL